MEKLTKTQIINKVVEHYKTNPRGLNADKNCVYYAPENGARCAVGLFMKPDIPEESFFGDVYSLDEYCEEDDQKLDDLLQSEVNGHDIKFWGSLQNFHDTIMNWLETETGNELTEQGQKELEKLLEKYKDE